MLNLQNDSTYQYVFFPIMQKRADGKIVAAWVESSTNTSGSTGNRRIGVCVINEDGTIAHPTSYTPVISLSGLTHLDLNIDPSDNYIYLGLYISANSSGYFYKFDNSLNYLTTATIVPGNSYVPGGLIWLDGNYLCTHIGTSVITVHRILKTTFVTSTVNVVAGAAVISYKSVLQTEGGSSKGIIVRYNGASSIHRIENTAWVSLGTLPTMIYGTSFLGFLGNKYIFSTNNTTNDLYYNIVNEAATVLSTPYLISGIFLGTSTKIISLAKTGINTIWMTTESGELHKLQQDLITGELSWIDKTTCGTTDLVVGGGSSVYLVNSDRTSLIKYIDPVTLAVSSQFNITTGSGFTETSFLSSTSDSSTTTITCNYKNNSNGFLHSANNDRQSKKDRGLIINESQMFHNLIYANNGPGGVNNINYQKTQLIFGYASSGTHESVNNVYNFNSFKFIPNYNVPNFTDITFYYSLNNGGSWTEITLGMENTIISATGSTQIKIRSVFNTLDTTVSPEYLDYALELIV